MKLLTRSILMACLLGLVFVSQEFLRRHLEAAGPLPVGVLSKPLAGLPLVLGDWHGRDRPITDARSLYADEHLQRTYFHQARRQELTLWMVYSRDGADRLHYPEVCLTSAGQPEDLQARLPISVDGHAAPVQQYRFGRPGDYQWVYYWFYVLPTPANEQASGLQRFYQKARQRPASVTIEVFAPESSRDDLASAQDFVRLLDAELQDFVGPTAIRGSSRVAVTGFE